MTTRFRVCFIFAGIILGLALIRTHGADGQPLRIAYTSIGISYGLLWLTKEAGIFKKHVLGACTRNLAMLDRFTDVVRSTRLMHLVGQYFID